MLLAPRASVSGSAVDCERDISSDTVLKGWNDPHSAMAKDGLHNFRSETSPKGSILSVAR